MITRVGKILKQERLSNHLTQRQLAKKSGVSYRTIQNLENLDQDPRFFTVMCLARAMDLSLDQIAWGKKENV